MAHNMQNLEASERGQKLIDLRNLKMARSAHAFVRGSTAKFYEYISDGSNDRIPHGPPVWICGDCHVGNLGPIASAKGEIDVEIRDLDQTVIGNPTHDLLRLGLSLSSAARGFDLSGVTTAKMIECLVEGYEQAIDPTINDTQLPRRPDCVQLVVRDAYKRSWSHLARERLEDKRPTIPLGSKFWPLAPEERREIEGLFETENLRELATALKGREDGSKVKVLDAAYWVKGCSSLGLERCAVLLRVGKQKSNDYCLMDFKEATNALAPHYRNASMPADPAQRVVEGARHLSPHLGPRMRASTILGRPMFVRELLPQDLKIEITTLKDKDAMMTARFLAAVVGRAHARQMDGPTRKRWFNDLQKNRSKQLDAPSWLWSSIVNLLMVHEGAYLEHCRRYALGNLTKPSLANG